MLHILQDVSVVKLCNLHVTIAKDKLCVNGDQVRGLWKCSITCGQRVRATRPHLLELGPHPCEQGKRRSPKNKNLISLLSIYFKWVSLD